MYPTALCVWPAATALGFSDDFLNKKTTYKEEFKENMVRLFDLHFAKTFCKDILRERCRVRQGQGVMCSEVYISLVRQMHLDTRILKSMCDMPGVK